MKKIKLQRIEDFKLYLETLLEERENYFNERTEKWQESEKGDFFYEQNESLETIISDLDSLIMEIENFNEAE